ncbi:chondroitin sulfate proteoglycan 4-like isoform 3-T3 [Porphyrio hochstetteri]
MAGRRGASVPAALLLLPALLLPAGQPAVAASFYGDSFVELNKAEASSQTSLRLRFRTSKPEGLLFLAAGKRDYCLIELRLGNLQLRINFGVGEQVLHSQQRSQLNDLAWHLVELYHDHDNVTLVIDKHDRSSAKMPGILYELNIDYGFYIGGTNKLDAPYLLGALPGFRGCIDDVSFNQLDILVPLRPSPGFKNIHEVSVGCSDEFFASEDESISFFSSRSYVSFPSWNVDDEGILEYTLQTSAARGLLLFHPGQAGDFIAMEMEDGLVKACIGNHRSRTQLSSRRSINDSHWHYIELKFTAEYLELTLDEETVKKSLPSHSKLPLLKGPFFVGGVDGSTRSEVIKLELASVSGKYARGGSFKGCLRDLKVNSEKKSLKNVLVTKDISAGCETESAFNTDLASEVTVKNPTVKAVPTYAIFPESSVSLGKEDRSHLLFLSNLIVLEGGKAALQSKHIKVNLDFQKLGIHQSQILFEVKRPPSHGDLKLDVEPEQEVNTFTMQDVLQGKILYAHDGSENTYDYFNFSISTSSEKIVPPYLQGNEQHMFSITVTPVNDAPEIMLPMGNVLLLFENSKKRLTSDLIKVLDKDTDPGDLSLSVLGNLNADAGFLENSKHPGKTITTFSNEDLREGTVFFVHTGVKNSRIVLRASDGEKVSNTVVLRVMAVPLDFRVVRNSGVELFQGVTALITPGHLTVETSAKLQELEIRDTCLDAAVHVRIYLESHQWPPRIVNKNNLLVEEGKPVKISKGKLQVVHENSSPSEIVFTVRQLPVHGYIRKFSSDEDYLGADQSPVLSFTQQDVDEGKVQYMQTLSDQLDDHFSLDVTNGVQTVNGIEISVDIIPRMIPLEVQNFTVIEGGSKALVEDYLKISNRHFAGLSCEFILIEQPNHGYIENSHIPGMKLATFTRKQVEQELIYYVHDDSEELMDNFTVIVNNTELWKQSLPQTVFITVMAVNDEPPVIKVNRILQVWVGSVTEITVDDLCAEDKDSSPSELIYSITPPSNGHLALKSSLNQSILSFTQGHIIEGQLVFVHNGAMSGGFNFQVTDGLNFAPRQIFSVTARMLVISLEENKGLGVFPGSRKPISQHDLKAVTNDVTNAGNRTITFMVVTSPEHGRLIRVNSDNTTQEIISFTQSMVDEGVIMYEHLQAALVGWSAEDFFTFTVLSPPSALDLQVFHIVISYGVTRHDRNSRLLANTGAIVQEGGRVLINKTNLDASNLLFKLPEIQRSMYEVWYQVVSLPQHGVIVVGERNVTKEKPNFSQYILNKFGIVYVHDNSESLIDNFTFAVWLNLKSKSATKPHSEVLEEMFNITVVPVNDQPPELKTKMLHLKVLQGDMSVLGSENLKVEDLDNSPDELKYTIVSNPNNGYLAMKSNLSVSVKDFTQADVDGDKIWFVQDGSSSSGVFYFSVTDGKHRPLYKLFSLEVIPISLVLVNLTNVVLPQGQTSVTITNVQLSAVTNGKSTTIMYEITQPLEYGHLMIGNEKVTKFEQADLYSGRLSYHLTNLSASKEVLEFMLFTAEGNLTGQVLNITVKPLVQVADDVQIPNQAVYKFRSSDLDASELGNLTNSNPRFEVIVPPSHGRIVKRRFVNDAVFEDIRTFTQSDIDRGGVLLLTDTNMTGLDLFNDSFTFVLQADGVQPAVGCFRYSVTPRSAPLVQGFPTQVPLVTSTTTLKIHSTSKDEAPATSQNKDPTVAPQKTRPTMWPERNRWENLHEEGPLLNLALGTSGSVGTKTITQVDGRSAREQAAESSNPWYIIIPLVLVSVVLIVAVLTVCILLMCQKKKKTKPLVTNQTDAVITSPDHSRCLERSLTVPSVTVTPLLRGVERNTSSASSTVRHEQLLPVVGSPAVERSLQNSWLNLDPEMIQYCRKTNPTLKRNQYWV